MSSEGGGVGGGGLPGSLRQQENGSLVGGGDGRSREEGADFFSSCDCV